MIAFNSVVVLRHGVACVYVVDCFVVICICSLQVYSLCWCFPVYDVWLWLWVYDACY